MNWKEKWEALERARKFLKLPLITTRKEIVEKYHALAKELHPDKGGDPEKMKALNEAYQLLMDYCDNYKVELKPNPAGSDPADFWFQHFGEDPVWGKFEKDSEERS
ncbi:molecular chaperone DnaJ [Caldimicrobium thiodismutans]|uniref:Molecular chaperone DnaJ n=1 Tax=Caldimicrobium thiodismutans TaxID=1653476 RepID=A0A0U4N3T8_9BACT|nr:DnaJ domain-containing protein [Caldimicrobium thiodismutans]BAU23958.1 molecular chaperone DnaJ [Caldimicrobium thiodismutans]